MPPRSSGSHSSFHSGPSHSSHSSFHSGPSRSGGSSSFGGSIQHSSPRPGSPAPRPRPSGSFRNTGFAPTPHPPMPRFRESRAPLVHVMPVYIPTNTSAGRAQRSQQINIRSRTNQPQGYTDAIEGYQPASFYHCRRHDYMYYPVGWYDTQTGEFRGAGYYDENGTYYPNAVIRMSDGYEAAAFCSACKKMVQPRSEFGGKWSCPYCAQPISDMIEDEDITGAKTTSSAGKKKSRFIWLAIAVVAAVLAFGNLPAKTTGNGGNTGADPAQIQSISNEYDQMINGGTGSPAVDASVASHKSSYYVEAIGRSCNWSNSYNCFFDAETQCYFVYNTNVDPSEWQYWYEGISSDYGDYGWMVYSAKDGKWFIEDKANHWSPLPSSYDTSYLWHIAE